MTGEPEAPKHLHRRLIRGIAAAVAAVAVAVAPAGVAAISSPTTHTRAEPRIGSNHNQVLI
jgi:hypothetical protein